MFKITLAYQFSKLYALLFKMQATIFALFCLVLMNLSMISSQAFAQPGGTIFNFSDLQEYIIQPTITFTPRDDERFQQFLFNRDQKIISEESSKTRPNFSISAARKRLLERDNELRIGVILPEKKLEKLVELMHYAAQMAFFDYGKQDARLFFYDIGEDDEETREVVKQATRDGIDIVLGPLFAESVQKIAPYIGASGLPMIAFSNSEGIAERGSYIFGLTPSQQAKQIINYALANDSKKIAIFTPENDYGRLVAETAKNELAKHGKSLSYLTYYDENSTDLSQQVRQFTHYDYRKLQLTLHKKNVSKVASSNNPEIIKNMIVKIKELAPKNIRNYYNSLNNRNILRAEAKRLKDIDTVSGPPFDSILVVVGSSRLLQTIISLFAFYDLNTQNVDIYGLQLWDEMRSLKNDPALAGALHISIDSPRYKDFQKRYKKLFNKNPPTLVSLVYDATILALNANTDGKIDPSTLHISRGYSGVGSHFRFLENGVVERLYSIKKIDGKNSQVVQIAPKIFPSNY